MFYYLKIVTTIKVIKYLQAEFFIFKLCVLNKDDNDA